MKIEYYIKYLRYILPIYMVCFLVTFCSKLDAKYCGHYDRKRTLDTNHLNFSNKCIKSCTDLNSITEESCRDLNKIPEELLESIKISNESEVKDILNSHYFEGPNILKLLKTDPEGNTYIHIAAGVNNGDEKLETAIMCLLLDKLKPLLLIDQDLLETCFISNEIQMHSNQIPENKLSIFIKKSQFWTNDEKIKNCFLQIKNKNYINLLLSRNNIGQTPLMVAMQRNNMSLLNSMLKYTHMYVGIDLNNHKDYDGNDFLDIILKEKSLEKLSFLIEELGNCNSNCPESRTVHFSNTKCKAENILGSVFTNKNKKNVSLI